MEQTLTRIILEVVAAAAVIYVVIVFLRYVGRRDDQFTCVVTNHMKHNTEALQGVKGAVDKTSEAVSDLRDVIRENNRNRRR